MRSLIATRLGTLSEKIGAAITLIVAALYVVWLWPALNSDKLTQAAVKENLYIAGAIAAIPLTFITLLLVHLFIQKSAKRLIFGLIMGLYVLAGFASLALIPPDPPGGGMGSYFLAILLIALYIAAAPFLLLCILVYAKPSIRIKTIVWYILALVVAPAAAFGAYTYLDEWGPYLPDRIECCEIYDAKLLGYCPELRRKDCRIRTEFEKANPDVAKRKYERNLQLRNSQ